MAQESKSVSFNFKHKYISLDLVYVNGLLAKGQLILDQFSFFFLGRTGKGRYQWCHLCQQWCHLCVGMVTTGGTWKASITKPRPTPSSPLKPLPFLRACSSPSVSWCFRRVFSMASAMVDMMASSLKAMEVQYRVPGLRVPLRLRCFRRACVATSLKAVEVPGTVCFPQT